MRKEQTNIENITVPEKQEQFKESIKKEITGEKLPETTST